MIFNTLAFISSTLKWICVVLLVIILVAMSAQVFFRYVLEIPLSHTDEIAQTALTWLTFLGSAWAYYEGRHIQVDLISHIGTPGQHRLRNIVVQIIVIISVVLLALQILDLAPLVARLKIGTLQVSRFTLHFLPLLISCVLIVLFASSQIVSSILARPDPADPE